MKNLSILLAVGFATLWLPPAVAVDQSWSPFDFAVSGALCPQTGDLTGSGLIHIVARDGGVLFTAKGTATNSSGVQWRFSDVDTLSLHSLPGDGSDFSVTENFHLIGQGSATDVFIRVIVHVLVRPDGTLIVNFEKDSGVEAIGCAGNLPQ